VALVAAFVGRTDWAGVGAALHQPRAPAWFAVVLGLYAVGQVTNGLAWRGLLASAGARVGFGEMIRHDLSSVFWSTVIPGGVAGEVVKGVRLARSGAAAGSVATSILAARLLGGTVSSLLALVLLPGSGLQGPPRLVGGLALTATASVGLVGLAVLRLGPTALDRVPRIAARLPIGRFPPAAALGRAALATLVTHLAFAGVYAACFGAAGDPLTLADGAAIYTFTAVAQMVPITVGGFGVRELTIASLGALLVPAPVASAAAVALTATFTVAVALGGLLELGRLRPGRW
jgi:uncharacterized membrane protein YbhN (UPF0104 family)